MSHAEVRGVKVSTRFCVLATATVASLSLASSAFAATFSNATAIQINDEVPAIPYPSTIPVTGMVCEITDVNVTLTGISHTHLDDVGVVVEAPGGGAPLPLVQPAMNSWLQTGRSDGF